MSNDRLEAYVNVIASAMPPGAAWQGFRDHDGVGHAFLTAKVATWVDVDIRSDRLVLESQPARAVEMLADHEQEVGLPDCCFQTAGLPIEDRSKVGISQVGGANSSGNSDSVRFDMLGATADMRAWWRIRVLGPRVTWFKVGISTLGQDPLARISRAEDLECLLGRYQPAHSFLTMSYEGE